MRGALRVRAASVKAAFSIDKPESLGTGQATEVSELRIDSAWTAHGQRMDSTVFFNVGKQSMRRN